MGQILQERIQQKTFSNPLVEAILNLLVAADYVRGEMETLCEKHGITQGQYNVLRILRGVHPDGHPRCEISRRLVERAADVTRLVDRLEAQGLAERIRSDKDRRLSLTVITKKGLRLLADMDPATIEAQERMGRRLSVGDCKELSRLCEAIYGAES